jgi:hypothetical protein
MKQALLYLAFTMLFVHTIQAQTFAVANTSTLVSITNDPVYHNTHRQLSKTSKLMIAGGCMAMGIGAAFTVSSSALLLLNASGGPSGDLYTKQVNENYIALLRAGIAFIAGGGTLLTEGVIQSKNHHKYTLIAPQKNELGVAYNF